MTRRRAVALVGALTGYLFGKPVVPSAQVAKAQQASRGLALILDGVDGIIVQYQGERIVVTPAELMETLRQDVSPRISISKDPYARSK